MIDPELVKEHYASLYDAELIQLAKKESAELTPEALILLKQELQKREIGPGILEAKDEEGEFHEEATPVFQQRYHEPEAALRKFDQRMPQQIPATHEIDAVPLSTEKIKVYLEKASKEMAINGVVFIAGFVITLCSILVAAKNGGTYVLAVGAVLFGGMRFFHAWVARNKFRSMLTGLNVISDEKKEEENK